MFKSLENCTEMEHSANMANNAQLSECSGAAEGQAALTGDGLTRLSKK